MASTVDVTLENLIEDTLDLLHRQSERPLTVTMGSTDPLANSADTTLELNAAADWDAVNIGDRLEYGTEVMLVQDKSADATPSFTVARAQFGTPNAGAVAGGEVMRLNAAWSRYSIWKLIQRFAEGALSTYLPFRTTQQKYRETDKGWVALDAETLDVFECFVVNDTTGNRDTFDNWHFEPTMPTGLIATGKALTGFPTRIADDQLIYIICQKPYQWYEGDDDSVLDPNEPADEADYIRLLYGGRDLVSLYVAGYLVLGREMTRMELDVVEEWTEEAAMRQGVNLRMVRELWTHFFRRVDELQKQHPLIKTRGFRRRKTVV